MKQEDKAPELCLYEFIVWNPAEKPRVERCVIPELTKEQIVSMLRHTKEKNKKADGYAVETIISESIKKLYAEYGQEQHESAG